MTAAAAQALFEPRGDDVYLPTSLARGPWSPESLHGGPPAALLTRAIEAVDSDAPMHVARVTVELLRPVPVAALRVASSVLRPGRKVQLVGASLFAGEAEVARAQALRIRMADVPMSLPVDDDAGDGAGAIADAPPKRPASRTRPNDDAWEAFHNSGVEMRYTSGSFEAPGPATVWMRLCQPLVAGEAPSPTQRVVAVADFGNGVSSVADFSKFLFINPDLSIHLARPPVGEWVCLDAVSRLSPEHGVGMAECALYDESGRIGRSLQSLLLDRRQ